MDLHARYGAPAGRERPRADERFDPDPSAQPAAAPTPDAGSRRIGRRLRLVANAPAEPAAYRCGLTPWEVDLLVLLMRGRTDDQIAAELGVDRHVIDVWVRSLLSGLGARDRIEAAVCLLRGVVLWIA